MQKTAAGVDVRASGPKTESDRTVSRGASDVHWGVWIHAPTLLGPREVVRTAANVPRPCSTGERSGLYGAAACSPGGLSFSELGRLEKRSGVLQLEAEHQVVARLRECRCLRVELRDLDHDVVEVLRGLIEQQQESLRDWAYYPPKGRDCRERVLWPLQRLQ